MLGTCFLVVFFLPKNRTKRDLLPPEIQISWEASTRPIFASSDASSPGHPVGPTLSFVMRANQTIFMGDMSTQETLKLNPKSPSDRLLMLKKLQPNLFSRSISFELLASSDLNSDHLCPLKVIFKEQNVLGSLQSCLRQDPDSVAHSGLISENTPGVFKASYELSEALNPGLHLVEFEESAKASPGHSLRVHTRKKGPDEYLEIASEGPVTLFELWSQFNTLGTARRAGYAVALALFSVGFLTATGKRKRFGLSLALLFASLAMGIAALMPYFAGNDETAHYTMLVESKEESPESKTQLIQQGWLLLFKENFYQINNAAVVQQGACLHQILGGCGVTSGPMLFYKYYFAALDFGHKSATEIFRIVRVQNLFFLGIFAFTTYYFLQNQFFYFLFLLLFCGGLFAQFPTITNDIFVYFCGLLGFVAQAVLLNGKKRALFPVLLFLGFIVVGLSIDSTLVCSFVVFANILFLAPAFALQSNDTTASPVASKINFARSVMLLTLASIFSLLSVAGAFSLLRVFIPWLFDLLKRFPSIAGFLDGSSMMMLRSLNGQSFFVALLNVEQVLESYFGEYVWSHFRYSNGLYLFFVGLFVALIGIGLGSQLLGFVAQINKKSSLKLQFARIWIWLLLCFQISVFCCVVEAVSVSNQNGFGGGWTYKVFRFYAPLMAVLLMPALLGLKELVLRMPQSMPRIMVVGASLWCLFLLGHWYPQFFLASAW